MRHASRVILAGVTLLVLALLSDLAGSSYHSLAVLVLSFALAVGGAVVAMRGMLELLGDLL